MMINKLIIIHLNLVLAKYPKIMEHLMLMRCNDHQIDIPKNRVTSSVSTATPNPISLSKKAHKLRDKQAKNPIAHP
jgi:hypothetical protein